MSDEPQVGVEEVPRPVIALRAIEAEVIIKLSKEIDGVSHGIQGVKAQFSEAQLNGVSLGDIAANVIAQAKEAIEKAGQE